MHVEIYILCAILFRIGLPDANITQDIQLSGPYIQDEHCIFESKDGK